MLETPDIQEELILNLIKDQYGLEVVSIEHLPIGADKNTAVYKTVIKDGKILYAKLRLGDFNKTSVLIPKFLCDCNIKQVIEPIISVNNNPWATNNSLSLVLCPYIEGRDGFEHAISDLQWVELGTILKKLHTIKVPDELRIDIPQEKYSDGSRISAKKFLNSIEQDAFEEPIAMRLSTFMKSHKSKIENIINRAEELAQILKGQNLEYVLCHGDIHAGNVFIDKENNLHVVDWDTLVVAPKERDLMFIGGGIGEWNKEYQSKLFYQGYGQTSINQQALSYYRYERIVEDIVDYCEQIFLTDKGGRNRKALLEGFINQFLPNSVVEIAVTQK